jgi:hypothetical protein
MDMSKLPHLSKSESPAPTQPETPAPQLAQPVVYMQYAAPGGPEAWISFAMGALFLLMNHRFLQFLVSPHKFVQDNPVQTLNGEIKYTDSYLFWSDLAITAFGLVLILDAFVLLKFRSKPLIAAALAITALTIAGNLFYLIWSYNSYGLAAFSAIAVGYGVYIAIFQWRMLQMTKV